MGGPPQLHLHHVARYRDDAAWPAPVWGKVPAREYGEVELAQVIGRLRECLAGEVSWQVNDDV